MANLKIIYPDIPARATKATTSATFDEREPLSNLKDGRRDNVGSSSSSDVLINYDLGSATTAAADHFIIARADKITLSGALRVQGSTVSRFHPSGVTGLKLWFDSNRSVTTVSGAVSTWTNLAASTNDATQGTAGSRPALSSYSGGVNGNRKVTFDGTDDYLTTAYAINPTGGFWVSCVVNVAATGATRQIIDGYTGAGARFMFRINASGTVEAIVFNGGANDIRRSSTATLSTNTTYVLTVTYDGTTSATGIKIYRDGTQIDTTSTTTGVYTVPTAGSPVQIGGPFSSQYMNGQINEVLWFEGVASTTDRTNVEAYLSTKWKTTPIVENQTLGSSTFYGTRAKDYIAAFSSSSAFRHWWIEHYGTTAFKPSKLYLGTAFNPSVDCEYLWKLRFSGDAPFVSDSGELRPNRTGSPQYTFELSWQGLTDSELNTFIEKIWKRRHKSGFFLYASAQGQVLNNATLVHVRLASAAWERVGKANYNLLKATFEELV